MKRQPPIRGDVLVSEPSTIGDLTFNRSVILLAHLDKEGAVGFIINKPLDFNLEELIPEIDENFKLFNGGPVEQENLYFIHDVPHLISDSVEIKDGIYWGGSFDTVVNLINTKQITSENIKFFLGYSGWDITQLESEIDLNTWIIDSNTKSNDILNSLKDGQYWQEKMKKFGGEYLLWSNAPENPNNN
ncbi:YqgE/AlgH family protein [Psychroflexus sp. CAK57W]|uniref:YqgE/AlgH family protein n=1 Tax=Psychroflexus curvus TaxID=2873595 RepID=UPI001CCEB1F3|nr:YqgE/AlgH family protein [Psychroflexus curvus]MBZ9626861.1 YqgE/AlgH family protein [Psychroflexus curvus]MBZ9786635.1 YqgE/AlgH family protein [Psychroflexus curvus]